MSILLFEDKLGITPSYKPTWARMCLHVRLNPDIIRIESLHKTMQGKLLVNYGNNKQPVFNPDMAHSIRERIETLIRRQRPKLVLLQDSATLCAIDQVYEYSRGDLTIDKLRGGVYSINGITTMVIYPISAINTHATKKDSMLLNNAIDKETWQEQQYMDTDAIYIPPYSVPYGRKVLSWDLAKAARLYQHEA